MFVQSFKEATPDPMRAKCSLVGPSRSSHGGAPYVQTQGWKRKYWPRWEVAARWRNEQRRGEERKCGDIRWIWRSSPALIFWIDLEMRYGAEFLGLR
jgi:hypothetical protein